MDEDTGRRQPERRGTSLTLDFSTITIILMILLLVTLVVLFFTGQSVGDVLPGPAENDLSSFVGVVERHCQRQPHTVELNPHTFRNTQSVTVDEEVFVATRAGAEDLRLRAEQCDQVRICQETTETPGCSAGGSFPGGERLIIEGNFPAQGVARLKLVPQGDGG